MSNRLYVIKKKILLLFKRGTARLTPKSLTFIALGLVVIAVVCTGILLIKTEKTEEPVEMADVIGGGFNTEEKAEIQGEENSFYNSVAIANVDTYVNIRSGPGTDFDIVGTINNNCAATIIGEENGWYNVESGNVKGYILAKHFLTGPMAEAKALEVGYVKATVSADTLNVRESQSTDSEILTTLLKGQVYSVVEYGSGWLCVQLDDSLKGWVNMDYVTVDVKFETALTLEEQAKRVVVEQKETTKTYTYVYEETADKAEKRAQVVAFALQFEGNPYVYAGRSLISGTDCSGFTSLVYKNFGYDVSPSSAMQPTQGVQVPATLDTLLPGDILYRGSDHVALYIGNGQVIHSSMPGVGIVIAPWDYHSQGWSGAVRIIN